MTRSRCIFGAILLLAAPLLAGCTSEASGTPFSYTYGISTSYQRATGAARDPPGIQAGDPARNAELDIVLLDLRHYPPVEGVVCSTTEPCNPPEDSPTPTGDLYDEEIEPATRVESGATIRIPRGEDHAHYSVLLDNAGKATLTVAGKHATKVELTLPGFGPTVDGCRYRYSTAYPGTAFVADKPESIIVRFNVGCYEPPEY